MSLYNIDLYIAFIFIVFIFIKPLRYYLTLLRLLSNSLNTLEAINTINK